LRKILFIAIVAILLGLTVLVEVYMTVLNPPEEYVTVGLPTLDIGVRNDYDFYKEGELVGNYSFWVEDFGSYEGQAAYYTRSLTTVLYEEAVIRLETVYIFNEDLNPLEYRLNASLGGKIQSIVCFFDGWAVDVLRESQDRSMENEVELAVNTVLLDNNMLGHWAFFFKSFDIESGKRMKFDMFVPQRLEAVEVILALGSGTEVLNLNGVEYECRVVRASDLNLAFYLHEGELLKLEELTQHVEISKTQ